MWLPSRCRTSEWISGAVPLSSWVARIFVAPRRMLRMGLGWKRCQLWGSGKNTMIRKALEIGHEQHPEARGGGRGRENERQMDASSGIFRTRSPLSYPVVHLLCNHDKVFLQSAHLYRRAHLDSRLAWTSCVLPSKETGASSSQRLLLRIVTHDPHCSLYPLAWLSTLFVLSKTDHEELHLGRYPRVSCEAHAPVSRQGRPVAWMRTIRTITRSQGCPPVLPGCPAHHFALRQPRTSIVDWFIPSGPTGMDPSQTAFFQAPVCFGVSDGCWTLF